MDILRRAQNSLRGLLHRYASEGVKRWMWNREYAAGRWVCLDSMSDDCIISHINAEARGGQILDMGCGPGTIGEAIDPSAYGEYLGVDISDVAIEKARCKSNRSQNRYVQGDMLTFQPPHAFDLIVFGDSLYYCSPSSALETLRRYSQFLSQSGMFIMRSWVVGDHTRVIVGLIESEFAVTSKQWYDFQDPMLVIAFRPKEVISSS